MDIILQDTDRDILEVLKFALQQEDFSVYAVEEFNNDFLNIIEQLRPHVVMLDYRLNGDRCIDICQQVKTHYPHLPVIAMSCNYNIKDIYDQQGFDDYIAKPFDLDDLYATLRKYIPRV